MEETTETPEMKKGAPEYRKVSPKLWLDPEWNTLSDDAQKLWFCCLTGPHTTMLPGLSVVPLYTLAGLCRMSPRKAEKALGELVDLSWVEYEKTWSVLRLPNALRYNSPDNPYQLKGWMRQWWKIPACKLRDDHLDSLREAVELAPTMLATIDEELRLGPPQERAKPRKIKPFEKKRQETVSKTVSQTVPQTDSSPRSMKHEAVSGKQEALIEKAPISTLCDPPAAVALTDDAFGPPPVIQTPPPVAPTPDRKPRQPKLVLTGEAPSQKPPVNPEHAQMTADLGRWLDRYRVWRNDPKATVPFPVFAQAWKARGIDDLLLALDGLKGDDFAKTCAPKALLAESMIAKGVGIARNGKPRATNPYEANLESARALYRQAQANGDWMPPEN